MFRDIRKRELMKKTRQRRVCIILIVIALLIAIGAGYWAINCKEKVNESNDIISTRKVENDKHSEVETEVEDKKEKTIQQELEEVEAKEKELESVDTSNMSQFEMNQHEADFYTLWDEELNSIWDRLTDQLSSEEKDTLVKEQQEWIAKKERNSEVAGIENGGGSLAPLLIAAEAADLTKIRVYYLAEKLAKVQGETFEVSDEVKKELEEKDKSLDEVLDAMKGQWVFDFDRGACIGIERTEESVYGQEDCEWVIWITGGDLYTEKDVYGYIDNCVVFHKADDDSSGYTVIELWNNSVSSWYGRSINELLNAGGLDESIVGY